MRVALILGIALSLVAGCKQNDAKALGEECFGTAECASGLTCDFGQSPPSCQPMQTPGPGPDVDADVGGDGDGDA